MRSLTPQERSTLRTSTYVTHLRVRVHRPDASLVDLTALLGNDWLMGVTWNETLDTPVAQASVTVRRSGPGGARQSLSPMVGGSLANSYQGNFVPLLQEGRYFRVEVQCTPGTRPTEAGWREVFLGRIDEVAVGSEEVRFTGRDLAGIFQDYFIETERNYGNDTVGHAVQTVMTSIIGDNVPNGTGPGLYVPVDPMWQLGKYTQKREPVYDALTALAEQLGWELRLMFREGHGWYLVFRAPERLPGAPVWTFGPEQYVAEPQVRRQLRDIRNVVEVVYGDAAVLDAMKLPTRRTVTSINPSSVTAYGRRWMQITEASNSNINTAVEAQRLADAAVADLSDSALEVDLELPFFWPLEIADFVHLEPDGVGLDTPQELAVISIEQTLTSDGVAKTRLQLRGRPATSYTAWMNREAAPGVAPLVALAGPDAPSELATAATVNGFALSFKPPSTGPAWSSFELHLSATPGFTPSNATLKAAASATRFEVADLVPGTTHYAVVRGRDAKGNVGPASAQVDMAPRYVEARMMAPLVTTASVVPNPDFEAANVPGAPPDTWTMDTGVWGVDAVLETSEVFSGSRAVRLNATPTRARLRAQRVIIRGGELVAISAAALIQPPGIAGRSVAITINWYDRYGAPITSTTVATLDAVALATYNTFGVGTYVQAPPTASYADVIIGKVAATDGQGAAFYALIDNVRVSLLPSPPGWTPVTMGTGFTADLSTGRDTVASRIENGCRVFLRGAIALSGVGTPGTLLCTVFSSHCPDAPETFDVRTNSGAGRVTVFPNGEVRLEAGGNSFVSLAGLSYAAPGT